MKFEIRDAGDLKAVNKQLRQQADGKQLAKDLTGALRDVLNPIRDQVKAAYRAQSGYQGKRSRSRAEQPPLHLLLARATKVEVRRTGKLAGARLRVDGRRMPPGMRSLPQYWEGYKPRWRWPVYGDRDTWAQGRARPIFDRTVEPYEDFAGRAVDGILEGVRARLEAGG